MRPQPFIFSIDELKKRVSDYGILPLGLGQKDGFSLYGMSGEGIRWHTGEEKTDPWEWRKIIAAEGELLYGKLCQKSAAFVSREWYPVLMNYRRQGYDFDAAYEDGLISRKEKKIMDLFFEKDVLLPAYEVKRLAGFQKGGEKGFDTVITSLQMKGYLIVRGLIPKRNRNGEPYGWPVSVYSTPEALLGNDFMQQAYLEDPFDSLNRFASHLMEQTGMSKEDALFLLK